MGVNVGVGVGVDVGVGAGVELGVGVGVRVGLDVGVGVGLGAFTTLKFTVIEAPLAPVPCSQLQGVTFSVWAPAVAGAVNAKEKGAAETVLTTTPSLANTTLCVSVLACAVIV